ncbi:arad-like aldolase/epimerase [Dacryopinax primogenitus]|uniref:Arad-like aldolase/epimerase n=1 Tax=Dacryopinax primogenitus (strain DJM 731) TaxID=1858805 RepID=M5FZM3_DACPD|nr:arad-like aldolase/epimerase [Dacryopinax primogenitus]EJU01335.1 arad-like aldolase/epimerase [Dacryopinax primogenitus]
MSLSPILRRWRPHTTPVLLRALTTPPHSGYSFPTSTDFSRSPFEHVSVGHSRITLPTFASKAEEEQYRKEHLAAVFRVLAREGLAEGIAGHCSVRSAIDPSKFYINPWSKSFFRMKASDLVLVDGDGQVVQDGTETQGRSVDASATGLHAPIYREAEDVCSIVHVHGPYSKAFSALGKPVEMINQDACAFHGCIIDVGFEGLVVDESEGTQIVSRMTPSTKIALLQNHGSLALGRTSPDEAAWWFLSFEKVCRAQLLVMSALKPGEKPILVNDEAREFTLREMGTAEMGWLGFAGYYEREEWEDGDFKK